MHCPHVRRRLLCCALLWCQLAASQRCVRIILSALIVDAGSQPMVCGRSRRVQRPYALMRGGLR